MPTWISWAQLQDIVVLKTVLIGVVKCNVKYANGELSFQLNIFSFGHKNGIRIKQRTRGGKTNVFVLAGIIGLLGNVFRVGPVDVIFRCFSLERRTKINNGWLQWKVATIVKCVLTVGLKLSFISAAVIIPLPVILTAGGDVHGPLFWQVVTAEIGHVYYE